MESRRKERTSSGEVSTQLDSGLEREEERKKEERQRRRCSLELAVRVGRDYSTLMSIERRKRCAFVPNPAKFLGSCVGNLVVEPMNEESMALRVGSRHERWGQGEVNGRYHSGRTIPRSRWLGLLAGWLTDLPSSSPLLEMKTSQPATERSS